MKKSKPITYKQAGVDIDAGDALVERIKPFAKATRRQGSMDGLGGFGALFDLKKTGYKDPILVSSTDGVGTKLKIAQAMNKHDTIGIDLVAMCVNDLVVQGAEPLFFLDYFATGKLEIGVAEQVIKGIAAGCKQADSALVGGETAEMPGMYKDGEYDLAGFSVGAVERKKLLPGKNIKKGDVVLGLASSGVHSNGFSLVRHIMASNQVDFSSPAPFAKNKTLGDILLTPTRIYVKSCRKAMRKFPKNIKAFAHITGGGVTENLPRVLPNNLAAEIKMPALPPIFTWLKENGNVPLDDLRRTFNCGIGMALVVSASKAKDISKLLEKEGEKVYQLGTLVRWKKRSGDIRVKKKIGVLISGGGSNLQALIDASAKADYPAIITCVISNREDAYGVNRAREHDIPAHIIDHKAYKTREDFESAMQDMLERHSVDIICLAGFMRLLSPSFVKRWQGRMLNIHPSFLPEFKGAHAVRDALNAGVKETGCTVHVVTDELDSGPILLQAKVAILPGDSEETLHFRIHEQEHKIYPEALKILIGKL